MQQGWSREKLPQKSGVGAPTIRDFECTAIAARSMITPAQLRAARALTVSNTDPKQGTVQKWRLALEAAGVRFIDGDHEDGPACG
jgi:hypothetical protein